MNKLLLASLLIITFALRFLVILRGDEMYDEISVVRSGEIYIGGIKNLDFSHDIWIVNYEHPPIAKYIFGLPGTIEHNIPALHKLLDEEFHPDKGYTLAKLTAALIGVVTVFLVYVVTAKWFDEKKAFFASLFLALMPHFIAHNAVAGLETPQALFSLLLVYFYLDGLIFSEKPNYKKLYASFGFFAILFLTKFSGLFFGFFYLFSYGFYLWKNKKLEKNLFLVNLSGVFVFLILIYILWPWLWFDPLNLLKSFGYFANSHGGEFFFGSLSQPPWYYYFAYFSATTPPLILLSLLVTLVLVIAKKVPQEHQSRLILVFAWFLVPFLISFLGLKQDGIRYVFSYIPPLAVLAGYGFSILLDKINQKFAPVAALLGVSTLMWTLVNFYPYYFDYYNIFYGGTQSVYENKRFDYAWWGEGINEAVEYVNKNFAEERLSVVQLLHPQHTTPLYDERLTFMNVYDQINPPDLVMLSEYHHYYVSPPVWLEDYEEVKSVDVVGLPLVRIYRIIK